MPSTPPLTPVSNQCYITAVNPEQDAAREPETKPMSISPVAW